MVWRAATITRALVPANNLLHVRDQPAIPDGLNLPYKTSGFEWHVGQTCGCQGVIPSVPRYSIQSSPLGMALNGRWSWFLDCHKNQPTAFHTVFEYALVLTCRLCNSRSTQYITFIFTIYHK